MSLRMAALGLIAQHPGSSGYDLLGLFQRSLANVWPATQSQLYGELNRLLKEDLIRITATGPRGRKEYDATPAGHREVRDWLTTTGDETMRNPFLLKVFLLAELDGPQIQERLTEAEQATTQTLHRLEALEAGIDWDVSPQDVLGRAVLDWGKRLCLMQADWLAETAGRLPAAASASNGNGRVGSSAQSGSGHPR